MVLVDRSACLIAPDPIASRFLALSQRVVVWGAQALVVLRVDEQLPVALMRLAMVNDGRWRDPACFLATLA
jgi:hypothetical protein